MKESSLLCFVISTNMFILVNIFTKFLLLYTPCLLSYSVTFFGISNIVLFNPRHKISCSHSDCHVYPLILANLFFLILSLVHFFLNMSFRHYQTQELKLKLPGSKICFNVRPRVLNH